MVLIGIGQMFIGNGENNLRNLSIQYLNGLKSKEKKPGEKNAADWVCCKAGWTLEQWAFIAVVLHTGRTNIAGLLFVNLLLYLYSAADPGWTGNEFQPCSKPARYALL